MTSISYKRFSHSKELLLPEYESSSASEMQENQSMIKYPVLALGKVVLVGYNEEAFKNFIGLEE